MIDRPDLVGSIRTALRDAPVSVLLGPRQCGKTTLANLFAKQRKCEYFDLEDPADLERLSSPMFALENLQGLVIIDEAQRKPDLFEIIRVLVDRRRSKKKFLLLGSASFDLVRGISESLAGRASFIEMGGFDLREIGAENYRRLWIRGGFPRSFLARSEKASYRWRYDFIRAFLERDIPQLGISIPARTMRRFWTMIAHYHGQVWNAAEFARSLGRSEQTARRYFDILAGAYMVRQLPPWYENLRKRQVKSPKMYVRDTGILHTLLTLETGKSVFSHPKLGASWEGFGIEQVLSVTKAEDAYFWATHSGAEIDLLIFKGGKRMGFEFKCTDAPRITKSIRIAAEDLKLDKVFLVCPGGKSYRIEKNVEVISAPDIGLLAHLA
ncbi:MAG: ATP-binding protein [Planctomycetota bacterium]|nr:ATP-binding protein [Planctomycetota bacterium]